MLVLHDSSETAAGHIQGLLHEQTDKSFAKSVQIHKTRTNHSASAATATNWVDLHHFTLMALSAAKAL